MRRYDRGLKVSLEPKLNARQELLQEMMTKYNVVTEEQLLAVRFENCFHNIRYQLEHYIATISDYDLHIYNPCRFRGIILNDTLYRDDHTCKRIWDNTVRARGIITLQKRNIKKTIDFKDII